MEESAGNELQKQAARFKFMFAGEKNMGLEQFLGVLSQLDSIVPVLCVPVV